jgi:hypothetical protein
MALSTEPVMPTSEDTQLAKQSVAILSQRPHHEQLAKLAAVLLVSDGEDIRVPVPPGLCQSRTGWRGGVMCGSLWLFPEECVMLG